MTAPRAGPADHPSEVRTLEWRDGTVVMIDQRRLPAVEVYVTCRTWEDVAEAIRTMIIRGAPAIGVAAAMGMALAARRRRTISPRVASTAGVRREPRRRVPAAAPSCDQRPLRHPSHRG